MRLSHSIKRLLTYVACRCLSGRVDAAGRCTEDAWRWRRHGRRRVWHRQRTSSHQLAPLSSPWRPPPPPPAAAAAVVVVERGASTQEEATSSVQQGADTRARDALPSAALRFGRRARASRQPAPTHSHTGCMHSLCTHPHHHDRPSSSMGAYWWCGHLANASEAAPAMASLLFRSFPVSVYGQKWPRWPVCLTFSI